VEVRKEKQEPYFQIVIDQVRTENRGPIYERLWLRYEKNKRSPISKWVFRSGKKRKQEPPYFCKAIDLVRKENRALVTFLT
jgi:hypothetical protein